MAREVEIILRAIDEASPTIAKVRETLEAAGAASEQTAKDLLANYERLRSQGFAPLDPAMEKLRAEFQASQQSASQLKASYTDLRSAGFVPLDQALEKMRAKVELLHAKEAEGIPIVGGYANAYRGLQERMARMTGEVARAPTIFGMQRDSVLGMATSFGLATTAVGIAENAFRGFYNFIKSSVGEALEAEDGIKRLQFTLSQVGSGGVNAKGLEEFFQTIQKTTRFTDDQARGAFTDLALITGNAGTAFQLLQRAVDISAVSGRELDTVVRTLGVAIETGEFSGKRLGLTLQGVSADMLRNADEGQRLNLVLEGTARFQDGAAKTAETMGGKLAILSNQWKELKKSIGGVLVEAEEFWAAAVNPPKSEALAFVKGKLDELGMTLDEQKARVWALIAANVDLSGSDAEVAASHKAVTGELISSRDHWAVVIGRITGATAALQEEAKAARDASLAMAGLGKSGFVEQGPLPDKQFADFGKTLADVAAKAKSAADYQQFLNSIIAAGGPLAASAREELERLAKATKGVSFFEGLQKQASEAASKMRDAWAKSLVGIVPKDQILSEVQALEGIYKTGGEAAAAQYLAALKAVLATGMPDVATSMQGALSGGAIHDNAGQEVAATPRIDMSSLFDDTMENTDGVLDTVSAMYDALLESARENALLEISIRRDALAELTQLELDALAEQAQVAMDAAREKGESVEAIEKEYADRSNKIKQKAAIATAKLDSDEVKAKKAALHSIANQSVATYTAIFGANKASAIAQALINTYEGVTQALAAYPPPYSIIMAALVAAQGMAAVANIRGTNFGKAASGGLVAGSGVGDTVPMMTTPGEGIVTAAVMKAIFGGRAAIVPMNAFNVIGQGKRDDDAVRQSEHGGLPPAVSHMKAASGGLVAGTAIGDRQPFMLSAGEVILPPTLSSQILKGRASIISTEGLLSAISQMNTAKAGSARTDRAIAALARATSSPATGSTPERGSNFSGQFNFYGTDQKTAEELVDEIARLADRRGYIVKSSKLVRYGRA